MCTNNKYVLEKDNEDIKLYDEGLTKTRAEVRGGGRKPWRQKGTGNARQGSIRAVQWHHGGIAHGPKPRDYSKKMKFLSI